MNQDFNMSQSQTTARAAEAETNTHHTIEKETTMAQWGLVFEHEQICPETRFKDASMHFKCIDESSLEVSVRSDQKVSVRNDHFSDQMDKFGQTRAREDHPSLLKKASDTHEQRTHGAFSDHPLNGPAHAAYHKTTVLTDHSRVQNIREGSEMREHARCEKSTASNKMID